MRARVAGPRLTSYRPAATAFSPSDLATGVDWWNAADTASITVATNNVTQINGQLGVHNLAQGTSSLQPLSGTATINGRNVIVFDTTDDTLNKASVALSQPLTEWIVFQLVSLGGTRKDLMSGGASQSTFFVFDRLWSLYAGSLAGTSGEDFNVHLAVSVFSGSSSHIYLDGSDLGTLNPGTNGVTDLYLGPVAGGLGANMRFCSGGFTSSAMSSGDRGNLRTWAQAYWGTP